MNRFFSVISSLSKYHVQDFLCCVFHMFKSVLAQFNSKINGPFLFRAVFRGGDLLPKVGSNYGKALCTLTRARTNFWIQNSRLYQT